MRPSEGATSSTSDTRGPILTHMTLLGAISSGPFCKRWPHFDWEAPPRKICGIRKKSWIRPCQQIGVVLRCDARFSRVDDADWLRKNRSVLLSRVDVRKLFADNAIIPVRCWTIPFLSKRTPSEIGRRWRWRHLNCKKSTGSPWNSLLKVCYFFEKRFS